MEEIKMKRSAQKEQCLLTVQKAQEYIMATHNPFFIYQSALTLGPFEETLFQSTNHYSQISYADSIERFIAQ